MAIFEILKYPDPFLKKKTQHVEIIGADIEKLIDDMTETMYFARGIGLAANQVGVDKRVVVLDVPDEDEKKDYKKGENLIAIINPEIIEQDGKIKYEEGCLSVPGFNADVKRFASVKVRGLDKNGKGIEIYAEGLFAIALQHEIDHLNGMLFIDRLGRLKREFIKKKILKAIEEERKRL
ncbi:MAG: peptide deformylase [Deltaproteobacteria bacterium]|nr:peptide deformylase [Deltaproteobacteria bacterium]